MSRLASLITNRSLLTAARVATTTRLSTPIRSLHLHEAYSMTLMEKSGIRVPKGYIAKTPDEAAAALQKLGGHGVIKAQVLAGGRGKGHFKSGLQGGVHVVNSVDTIRDLASKMIGQCLVTKQTGNQGRPCNMVYIVERLDIIKECYFAILMDRASQGPMIVASSEGGMDIETVASQFPSAIIKEAIDVSKGLTKEQADSLAARLGFSPQSVEQASSEMIKLYKFFTERDATMVEINPFAQDSYGNVLCLDSKVNYDDNALGRQKEVLALRDFTQENPLDVQALKNDLNYIGLDGNIGCLVNGAGLAMATMDIIQLYGGRPANFLDIGGGATREQVIEALRIITANPKVNCIFVNIFGGIMRCDVIAEGLVSAATELDLKIPLVVRLQGTRKVEAKAIIASSVLDILSADELDHAAQKAVKVSRMMDMAKEARLYVRFKDNYTHDSHVQNQKLTPNFT